MKNPNFVLLYVKDPGASSAFYSSLLGRPVIESSTNFAMLALTGEVVLGLWAESDVAPAPTARGGGAEIGIPAGSVGEVDAVHADWKARSVAVAQAPVQMDFGYTFVALDPDGHRIRVYFPRGA